MPVKPLANVAVGKVAAAVVAAAALRKSRRVFISLLSKEENAEHAEKTEGTETSLRGENQLLRGALYTARLFFCVFRLFRVFRVLKFIPEIYAARDICNSATDSPLRYS